MILFGMLLVLYVCILWRGVGKFGRRFLRYMGVKCWSCCWGIGLLCWVMLWVESCVSLMMLLLFLL